MVAAPPATDSSRSLDGLHATLRASSRDLRPRPVEDLTQGGMAVADPPEVVPDEVVRFELRGPGFSWSGTARVAHVEHERVGLQFLGWDGPAHRGLRALLDHRRARR